MKREEFILSALLHRIAKTYTSVFNLYGYTPVKDTLYQNLIQKAELWSSSGQAPQDSIPKYYLHSVLGELNAQKSEHTFEPVKITLQQSFFPKNNNKQSNYTHFEKLIQEFFEKANLLPRENLALFIENCTNLLHKYTVTIPCGIPELSDVSLYDHSRMTAAIATCLYDYVTEYQKNEVQESDKPVLFLGGSISGIQKYIYNIISKFATKNLKGRSFFLQLLVDSVIEKLLYELKLFHTNIVYASGGGFYLLVPNTENTKKTINEVEKLVSDAIFREFGTQLLLNIAFTELSYTEISGQNNALSQKWTELIDKLNRKKGLKYVSKLVTEYTYFFEETEQGGLLKKDVITNQEISTKDLNNNRVYEITEEDILQQPVKEIDYQKKYVLELTKQQIDLGKYLRQTRYIVQSTQVIEWKKTPLHYQNPMNLGIHWYFFDELPTVPEGVPFTLIQFNNPDDFNKTKWNSPADVVYSFAFYGGNQAPVRSDNWHVPKNFNDLAGDEKDSFKRLGILRMDVDNLGNTFTQGLGKYATFARYSALSRSLDYFFKGYINTIWKSKSDFEKWIYIVYAGGDDLFIVGKWDKVIEFAEAVRTEFKKWACHNPKLTLSAGVSIVTAKYPILKAADTAGEAEEKAKNHKVNGQQKNAICILDIPLNWEHEFPLVKELKDTLSQWLKQEKLPKGFLHKIQTFYQMSIIQRKSKENESWRWIMSYDFKRALDRKKDDSVKIFITDLKNSILTNTYKGKKISSSYSFLELLNLSARWAELELKNDVNFKPSNTKNYEYI